MYIAAFMLRRILVMGTLVAVGTWAVANGFFLNRKDADNPGAAISTAKVQRGTVETEVETAGDILPTVQVDVKPEVGARIEKVLVKESDVVKAGQSLVELDNTELLTEKSGAETNIRIAELELEQVARNLSMEERLMDQRLITPQKFGDRTTEREIAEHKLVRAKQALENVETKLVKTRILAPLSGTVLAVPVVEGQVAIAAASVSSGTLLMSIADLSALQIDCHINQVDVARLAPEQAFTFTVDTLGPTKMSGRIGSVAPVATIVNGIKGFRVVLKIDRPDARLRPGMTADVAIPTGRATDVLTVPLSAVFAGEKDGKVAFVRKADGSIEERAVEAGLSNMDVVEILSGLEDGETVLLTRPEKSDAAES